MITKKSLILNLSYMIFVTIVLVICISTDINDTIKFILIGTIFMLSALISIVNRIKK